MSILSGGLKWEGSPSLHFHVVLLNGRTSIQEDRGVTPRPRGGPVGAT